MQSINSNIIHYGHFIIQSNWKLIHLWTTRIKKKVIYIHVQKPRGAIEVLNSKYYNIQERDGTISNILQLSDPWL